jgi:hypothetical protein
VSGLVPVESGIGNQRAQCVQWERVSRTVGTTRKIIWYNSFSGRKFQVFFNIMTAEEEHTGSSRCYREREREREQCTVPL